MLHGTELNSEEKWKICFLKSSNVSIRKLADEIHRLKSVVGNYLKDSSKYRTSSRKQSFLLEFKDNNESVK